MPLIVYNPTNETFEATYIGETTIINPGDKIRMDDNRARHLLNHLGPRGLMQLEYGDEANDRAGEKAKEKEGIKRNEEFKRKQVLKYNQTNESHKQQGLPYVPVPPEIQEYAKELGLVLVQPYQFKDKEVEEIAELRKVKTDQQKYIDKLEETNVQQAKDISDLKDQVRELVTMLKPQAEQAKADAVDTGDVTTSQEAEQVDLDRWRSELGYVRLTTAHFENWVARRWDDIMAAPPEIQAEIQEKFRRFYNKPFPTDRPEVQDAA